MQGLFLTLNPNGTRRIAEGRQYMTLTLTVLHIFWHIFAPHVLFQSVFQKQNIRWTSVKDFVSKAVWHGSWHIHMAQGLSGAGRQAAGGCRGSILLGHCNLLRELISSERFRGVPRCSKWTGSIVMHRDASCYEVWERHGQKRGAVWKAVEVWKTWQTHNGSQFDS